MQTIMSADYEAGHTKGWDDALTEVRSQLIDQNDPDGYVSVRAVLGAIELTRG
jgi:hypothetical protein